MAGVLCDETEIDEAQAHCTDETVVSGVLKVVAVGDVIADRRPQPARARSLRIRTTHVPGAPLARMEARAVLRELTAHAARIEPADTVLEIEAVTATWAWSMSLAL